MKLKRRIPTTRIIFLSMVWCLAAFPLTTTAQQVENLAANPSFEDNNDRVDDQWQGAGWVTWGDGVGLQSKVSIDKTEKIDGAQSLFVEPNGAENWHFMVINWPILLEVGKTYTASFWAKAEQKRPLTTKFKASDNSVDWSVTDYQLTTEWEEYHVTAEALNGDIKFEIWVGASLTPLWLDFFSFYEGDYVEGIMPSEATQPVEPNGKLTTTWSEVKVAR